MLVKCVRPLIPIANDHIAPHKLVMEKKLLLHKYTYCNLQRLHAIALMRKRALGAQSTRVSQEHRGNTRTARQQILLQDM